MASAEDLLTALRAKFASEHWLTFDVVGGLVRLNIATHAATATIFLQGAHLAAWQPAGEAPTIYLTRKSPLEAGKPLRGGVPVVFPWFATDSKPHRIDGHPGPSHGFARLENWTLETARMRGHDAELVFTLGPSALSRSMGFDAFALTLTFLIGRELSIVFDVRNPGQSPLEFEQALHTYYQVADIHEVEVLGLEPTGFIDKTDQFRQKPAEHHPLRFTAFTDRVYQGTEAPCVIRDRAGRREITVRKQGSRSTITWNPFKESADIGPWDWHDFVAVETANVGDDKITLAPGASHRMVLHASIHKA